MELWDLVQQVEKQYGDGTIRPASTGRSFVTRRFQTGVFDFDANIGGGVPWGRFLRAFGPFSGGKTVLWLKAIAGCQKYCRYCRDRFRKAEDGNLLCSCPTECPECGAEFQRVDYDGPEADEETGFNWRKVHDVHICECLVNPPGTKAKKDRVPKRTLRAGAVRAVWLDAESCFDRDWSCSLGVDNDTLYVILPEYAEQGVDVIEAFIRSGEVDLIVVDSLAEMTPMGEIESSTEDWQVALHARLVNKAMRKWGAAINRLGADAVMKPAVLLVNQTRESMHRGEVTPGGWQQYFKSSVDIRLNKASYKKKETGTGVNNVEEVEYADISGQVRKNKTFVSQRRFSFRLYVHGAGKFPTGSTNELGTVVDRALEYRTIDRPRTTQYVFKNGSGKHEWSTQKQIIKAMREDEELFWAIRDETMRRVISRVKGDA
jgi:RecA/RadA recombinase